jgi:hypothetical protein
MILKFLRSSLRLLVTLLCTVGAGVLGWCLIGWMHGEPNAPQAILHQFTHAGSGNSDIKAGHKESLGSLASALEELHQGSVDSALRKIYLLSKEDPNGEGFTKLSEVDWQRDGFLTDLIGGGEQRDDNYAGSVYVANVLRTWFSGDHASCLEAVGKLPPYLQGKVPTRLLKAATFLNGKMAMQMLGPHLLKLIPPDGMDVTVNAWAQQDPVGALAFAQQMSSEKHRTLALKGVMLAMTDTDPARSLQLLDSVPVDSRKDVARRILQEMEPVSLLANSAQIESVGLSGAVWGALGQMATTDPAAAQQWLKAHSGMWEDCRGLLDMDLGSGRFTGQNGAALLNLCASALAGGETSTEHIQRAIFTTANALSLRGDSAAIQSWLGKQTDPVVIVPAIRGALISSYGMDGSPEVLLGYWQQLQQLDPVAAARSDVQQNGELRWMQHLFHNLPEEKLAQYTPMLSSLTPTQQAGLFEGRPALFPMETALPLTFQINDYSSRLRFEHHVVQTYAADHPQEIQTWINQLPTAEERTNALSVWPKMKSP